MTSPGKPRVVAATAKRKAEAAAPEGETSSDEDLGAPVGSLGSPRLAAKRKKGTVRYGTKKQQKKAAKQAAKAAKEAEKAQLEVAKDALARHARVVNRSVRNA